MAGLVWGLLVLGSGLLVAAFVADLLGGPLTALLGAGWGWPVAIGVGGLAGFGAGVAVAQIVGES